MATNQAGELLYREWAPPADPWSPWVKPSLFATITATGKPLPWEESQRIDTFWARAMMSQTAIVVDLPGIESLHTAVALAREGYRPVPLYNTSPGEPLAIITQRRRYSFQHTEPRSVWIGRPVSISCGCIHASSGLTRPALTSSRIREPVSRSAPGCQA